MADTTTIAANELAEMFIDIRHHPDGARDIRNFLLGLAIGIDLSEHKPDPSAA